MLVIGWRIRCGCWITLIGWSLLSLCFRICSLFLVVFGYVKFNVAFWHLIYINACREFGCASMSFLMRFLMLVCKALNAQDVTNISQWICSACWKSHCWISLIIIRLIFWYFQCLECAGIFLLWSLLSTHLYCAEYALRINCLCQIY